MNRNRKKTLQIRTNGYPQTGIHRKTEHKIGMQNLVDQWPAWQHESKYNKSNQSLKFITHWHFPYLKYSLITENGQSNNLKENKQQASSAFVQVRIMPPSIWAPFFLYLRNHSEVLKKNNSTNT